MMSRRLSALLILLATGLAFGLPVRAGEPVSQRDNEARSILERISLYQQRHGIRGELDSGQMLERARWGYQRWLETEVRRLVKGASVGGWVSLGPSNGAGRMTAIAPHPSSDGTILAGAASGGVWKTTDHGASWRPLTDGLSDLSVGALALARSNPEVVYIGSGEAGLGGFFVPGIGLIRSSDGGETWFLPQPGEVVAEQFFALSVDPRSEDHVLAATERGLFASDDGGVSWDLRLGHPDLFGVTEIIRSTTNPDHLWSSLWCFSSCPEGLARVMASLDGGVTWAAAAGGLPDTVHDNPFANRTALAAAPSDDRVLYAAINTSRNTPYGPEAAIYRSSDGGSSWENTADPGPYLLLQGWYNNAITIDPTDPDVVVAAGVWYVRTTDGGASWTAMDPVVAGDWMGTETVPHVDGHAFAWQGDTLWLGCDGGVWLSHDGGATWSGRNDGLVTRQYYGLDIDPIRRDRVLGGTQDNKTNLKFGPGDTDWEWVIDGDGFECAINPLVPDLVYGTIYGTLVFRSFDGGSSWQDISPPIGGDRAPFATPLTMAADLPWRLLTGSSRVWLSADAGSTWNALGTEVANGEWSSEVISSLAVTPIDPDRLMIGKGSAVYSSTDSGSSWRVSPMTTMVNSVALSPFDPGMAMAALARVPAGEPQLLRTSDGGLTWNRADTGLPPFAIQVVRWHPQDADVVFAGTDVGLYHSSDGGLNWFAIGDGLPAASIHDLRIAEDGSRVVVASHGRGIWELELAEPTGEAPSVTLDGPGRAVIGEPVAFSATATDPDGGGIELRWLSSDDWRLMDGGAGVASLSSSLDRVYSSVGQVLVAANAIDETGRTGFASMQVTVYEPGDDCSTPRVIPGDGPWPHTILTENRTATSGPEDPVVECATWPGDPDSGRWRSIWLEFTPLTNGTYTFSTCGSVPDTVLSAWTGPACGPLQAIAGACHDDDRLSHCLGRDTDSWLSLDLTAGTTIRLMVGTTKEKEKGDVRITVDCPSCRPVSDLSTLLVSAAAHTPGSEGSFWISSAQLINAGEQPATAGIELLPGSGSPPATLSHGLEPGEALTIADIVGDLLGGRGAGALRLTATGALVATTRTATTSDGGSYGQGIPAAGETTVAVDGEAVRLIGFSEDAGFRTNLGLVNPGADEVSLIIRFYDREAASLGDTEQVLGPESWIQLNRVFADFGISSVVGSIVTRQTSKTGSFSAYASVVDEQTGDPTFLAQPGVGRTGDPLWIPAAAHTDGVGGARWRTDLTMMNPGSHDLVTRVELLGPDGVVAATTVHVPDGRVRQFPDVISETFATEGGGALRITPTFGLVMATSRTYATTADGSHGQGIPGVAGSMAFTGDEVAFLPGLRQDNRFRTNIGIANTGEGAVVVEVTAHAENGDELGTLSIRVEGSSWMQANQPLPRGTVYATITTETPGAAYHAYASVVDRSTDDPTYIAAVRAEDR